MQKFAEFPSISKCIVPANLRRIRVDFLGIIRLTPCDFRRRLKMQSVPVWCCLASITIAAFGIAQEPGVAPPALLPPSITKPAPEGIVPASANIPKKAAFPADRFSNRVEEFPAETLHAVYSTRVAADWLCRMNQASGLFMAGVNPALARPLADEGELKQAYAVLATARVARFTGDAKLAMCANQGILALLTFAPEDPQDQTQRVPKMASERCNRVGFASLLAMAIWEVPTSDAKLQAEADRLCNFLKKQCRADGSVHYVDAADGVPTKIDPDGVNTFPALCFQALLASDRTKPDQAIRDTVLKGLAHYQAGYKSNPHPMLAANLLPVLAEMLQRGKSDSLSAFSFELADSLCNRQYVVEDAREKRWIGGIRLGAANTEPTATTATCAEGLAAATAIAGQIADLPRFAKYRKATMSALVFCRGLQCTDENCAHFERSFRASFLLGGVGESPSAGNLWIDTASKHIFAHLRFLASGAERGN